MYREEGCSFGDNEEGMNKWLDSKIEEQLKGLGDQMIDINELCNALGY